MKKTTLAVACALALSGCATPPAPGSGRGWLAVSANDNKAVLVDGVTTPAPNAAPDTVAIIDLRASPPRLVAEIDVPASVVGPPSSVAVAPDESIALVTAAQRLEGGKPVPNDRVTVVDLQAKPPRVIGTISVGQTPEGIACSPDGRKVAVVVMSGSNKAPSSPFYRANGRVVLFNVEGKKLTPAGEADIGNWSQGAAFSPDGRTLLVQNMVQKNLQVFEVTSNGVRDTGVKIPLKGGGAGIGTAR